MSPTLGIGPIAAARVLGEAFLVDNPRASRYEFPSMFRWLAGLEPERMAEFGLKPSYIRRISERLSGIAVRALPQEVWTFAIAGWRYYAGPAIAPVPPGAIILMQVEPGNRYDKNAIALFTEDGKKLGYVPRATAVELSRVVNSGDRAEIENARTNSAGHYEVLVRFNAAMVTS